jgi:hypothetical protein
MLAQQEHGRTVALSGSKTHPVGGKHVISAYKPQERDREFETILKRFKPLTIPDGLLRFSDAISRLAEGMWGGLRRPVPVQAIKQTDKKASIGFGPWRERAGQRLTAAVTKGKLAVYVFAKPQPLKNRALARRSPQELEPVTVPVSVLARLRTTRGSLPDHPIRPSMKTAEGDEKLLGLLTVGVLVIRASDFDVWYQSERAKGKWPSQRSKLKIGGGRPTKQADRVRNAVIRLVRDNKWSGKASIAKLHRLLIASGDIEVPSPDTLARLVEQLHAETGEAEFLRAKRPRRKRARTPLPQNPVP